MASGDPTRVPLKPMSPSSRTIAIVVAVILVVAIVSTFLSLRVSWREIAEMRGQAERIEQTYEVLRISESLFSLVKDAESGQRGFVLTGDEGYLAPYQSAIAEIPGVMDRLDALAAGSPRQASHLADVRRLVDLKLSELARTIELRRTQGRDAALDVVASGEGMRTMKSLREVVDAMSDAGMLLLRRHSGALEPMPEHIWTTIRTRSWLLMAALSVALVFVLVLVRRREQLVRARDLLSTTLASIGDAVLTTDTEGRIQFLNAVAEVMTGWRSADAEGRAVEDVFRIVDRSTREVVESPTVRALREGVPVGLVNQTILIAKDGSERAIDDSASPIRGEDDEYEGVVLIFRDITERVETARRIRESERRRAAIIESSLDGVIKIDHDGRIIEFNPAAEQIFGHRREDVIGKPMSTMIIPPSLRASHERGMAHFRTTGEGPVLGRRLELSALRADGTEFPIELAVSRIPSDGPPMFAAFLRDITDRKRSDQRVLESELRYRRVFESARDGVLILDAGSGKIIDSNAFMVALLGLDHSEMVGKNLHEVGLLSSAEENATTIRQLQRTGYIRNDRASMRNRRDERIDVEFIGSTYHEDDRLLAQFNVRRITERIAMQKKLADQAASLMAESRRKDEFLAILSHELRNPLAPILTAVQMLKVLPPGEDAIRPEAHGIIERQVGNLTRLIKDLLEVSRVLSGRVHLEQKVVDLNLVIEHAVETARPLIDQRGHELEVHHCGDGIWANVDAIRMEEVLVNLLNNAAKYTPEGGRIEIHCEHPRGASYVQVRVRDNGIGIDPELLQGDRIFDLFMQSDRSLDRAQGGLGLGLSVARRLIDLHGGSIEVNSPPDGADRGSEFVVRLPLMLAPITTLTAESAPRRSAPDPKSKRVLIVDDNVDLVAMVANALRLKGYAVQVAYTGPAGLQMAQRWKPDVILMDIGLPTLDGYEVARRLRADVENFTRGFPGKLIAATGYGRDSDIALAREAGFDAHLVKPYDLDDLEKLIE